MISEFQESCGAVGPLVFNIERDDNVQSVTLNRPFGLIGRFANADLIVEEPEITGRYAYLQVLGGRLLCVGLRRTPKGAHSKRLACEWLTVGQSLRVGSTKIRLMAGLPAQPVTHESLQMPQITVESAVGDAWNIWQPLTLLGSSRECDIHLDHPSVSRFHAALVTVPDTVWMVSLLGRHNEAEITCSKIQCGEELGVRIGEFKLRIRASPYASGGELLPATLKRSLPTFPSVSENVMDRLVKSQEQMFDRFQEMMTMIVQTFNNMHREQAEHLRREMERVERLDREIAQLCAMQMRNRPTPLNVAITAEPVGDQTPNFQPIKLPSTPAGQQSSSDVDENVHSWLGQRFTELQRERQGIWARVRDYVGQLSSSVGNPTKPV